MEMIKEWVTNIILFVLFATLLDMLLPSSKFQKYTKMVVGLLLIAIILTPILKFFTQDFEETLASVPALEGTNDNQIKNLIELQKKEIQASQNAYIFKQMAVQLKEDAEEELMDRYGLEVTELDLEAEEIDQHLLPENIQKVVIQLREPPTGTDSVAVVKSVEINTEQPIKSETNKEQKKEIIKLLAKKWGVDENAIDLQIDGGE